VAKRSEEYRTLFCLRPPRKRKTKVVAEYVDRLLTIAVNKWERTTPEERRRKFGSRCKGLEIAKARRERAARLAQEDQS
jgi:hypothetical protein